MMNKQLWGKVKTGTLLLLGMLMALTAGEAYAAEPTNDGGSSQIADYYKKPGSDSEQAKLVSPRSGAYDKLAAEITAGCESNYDKLRAIYEWICKNIAYDTSFTIRKADQCLAKRKGVCQGYCDLFVQLARAVDIRVEVVEGKAKDVTGFVNPNGHGWLFAYTRQDHGILLDPTWGAGYVENGQFVREKDCWQWFNVLPEWMILSHLPNAADYQLLTVPVSEQDFLQYQPISELWAAYGLDLKDISDKVRRQAFYPPRFFNEGEGIVELKEIPMSLDLRVGVDYVFRIKMNDARDFVIMNNNVSCRKEEWKDEGDGIYSVTFMPRDTVSLLFCIRDEGGTSWQAIVKYEIEPPTAANWRMVERRFPLMAPDVKAVEHLNADLWGRAGIPAQRLVNLIREQKVTSMPTLYPGKETLLTLVNVPMNRQLTVGQEYSFSMIPKDDGKWALHNEGDWQMEWQVAEDGLHTTTITPSKAGRLSLMLQDEATGAYWPFMEYDVVAAPTPAPAATSTSDPAN